MKNFLKKLTTILTVLIFVGIIKVSAFDMGKLNFEIDKLPTKVGDTFKAKIFLDDRTNSISDLDVKFDNKLLEVVDADENTNEKKFEKLEKKDGFLEYRNIKTKGAIITFKVLKEGTSEISAKVIDSYIRDEARQVKPEEIANLNVTKTINIKPEKVNEVKPAEKANTTNTTDKKPTTPPVQEKKETSIFKDFFNTVGNDWVLKILIIAIIVIFLIIITLLVEAVISSSKRKKNKKEVKVDEYPERVHPNQRRGVSSDTVIHDLHKNNNNGDYRVNIRRDEDLRRRNAIDVRARRQELNPYNQNNGKANINVRELVPEQNRNHEVNRPVKRVLTVEEKRILLARRRMREQQNQSNKANQERRQVRRPLNK